MPAYEQLPCPRLAHRAVSELDRAPTGDRVSKGCQRRIAPGPDPCLVFTWHGDIAARAVFAVLDRIAAHRVDEPDRFGLHSVDGRVFVPPIGKPVQQRQDVGAGFGELVLMACARPTPWYGARIIKPSSTSRLSRADRILSAIPKSALNWSKRVIPTLAFFRISNVHLSASTSTARVIGQCASEIGLLAMGTYFLRLKLTCNQQAYYSLAANCAVNAVAAAKRSHARHPSPRARLHKITANNSKGTTMNQPSSPTQERAQRIARYRTIPAVSPVNRWPTPARQIRKSRPDILPIAPGAVTEWMVHPVPGYLYVLEGILTVEFADDGSRQSFEAGQAFLQARAKWHRGRNDGNAPVRFSPSFAAPRMYPRSYIHLKEQTGDSSA